MIRSTTISEAIDWDRAAAAVAQTFTSQYNVGDKIRHKELGKVGEISDIRSANAMIWMQHSCPMIPFEDILRDWEPA